MGSMLPYIPYMDPMGKVAPSIQGAALKVGSGWA